MRVRNCGQRDGEGNAEGIVAWLRRRGRHHRVSKHHREVGLHWKCESLEPRVLLSHSADEAALLRDLANDETPVASSLSLGLGEADAEVWTAIGEVQPLALVVTQWANAAGGFWNNPANWSNGVPSSGHQAVIDGAGTYTIYLDVNASIGALSLGAGSGIDTQTLSLNGRTLTLGGESTVAIGGHLDLGAGLEAN
jgi:hypothetical protein